MTWHADEPLLARYAQGEVDQPTAFSVEAHLVACETCRRVMSDHVDTVRLERLWMAVEDAVDAPRPGVVERLLARVGVAPHLARLLTATPSLSASWLGAVGIALAFAVVAAQQGDNGVLVFLVVAPLLPVAGVAAAYGPGVDPTYEVGLASPTHNFRLLLLRCAAVLVTTLGLVGPAALALPGLDWQAAAWLLPALGLSLATLALSSVLDPLWAGSAVAVGWVTMVVVVENTSPVPLAAFRAGAQVGFLVLAMVSAGVVAMRRERFDCRRAA